MRTLLMLCLIVLALGGCEPSGYYPPPTTEVVPIPMGSPYYTGGQQTQTTVRTTTRNKTAVSPTFRPSFPLPAPINNYAPQTASHYQMPAAPTGSSLSNRSGQMSNFTVRDTSRPQATGTAFGASRPSSPSPSFSRPSSPSPSPSRSFGSSSSRR